MPCTQPPSLSFLLPELFTSVVSAFADAACSGGSIDFSHRISANAVCDFLRKTNVPDHKLAAIWSLVDSSKCSSLSFPEFALSCTLAVHCLDPKYVVPTRLDLKLAAEISAANFYCSKPAACPSQLAMWVESISAVEKNALVKKFYSLPLSNMQLPGSQCHDVFVKYGLPRSVLAAVWDICDSSKSGSLDIYGFLCASVLFDKCRRVMIDPSSKALNSSNETEALLISMLPCEKKPADQMLSRKASTESFQSDDVGYISKYRHLSKPNVSSEVFDNSKIQTVLASIDALGKHKSPADLAKECLLLKEIQIRDQISKLSNSSSLKSDLSDLLNISNLNDTPNDSIEFKRQRAAADLLNSRLAAALGKISDRDSCSNSQKIDDLKAELERFRAEMTKFSEFSLENLDKYISQARAEINMYSAISTSYPVSRSLDQQEQSSKQEHITSPFDATYSVQPKSPVQGGVLVFPKELFTSVGEARGKLLHVDTNNDDPFAEAEFSDNPFESDQPSTSTMGNADLVNSWGETNFESAKSNQFPVLFTARALFRYISQQTDQIDFNVGDIIDVIDDDTPDWFIGRIGDKIGWFPRCFVTAQNALDPSLTSLNSVFSPQISLVEINYPKCVALYEYSALNDDELSCKPGDQFFIVHYDPSEDWWLVRGPQDVTGLLPAPYLSIVDSNNDLASSSEPKMLTEKKVDCSDTNKRRSAIKEFLHTEAKYIDDLKIVHDLFIPQLSSILSQQDLDTLFGNWNILLEGNSKFYNTIESDLKKCKPGEYMIGKIFIENSQVLDPYKSHCSGMKLSLNYLVSLMDSPDSLAWKTIQTIQKDPNCKFLTLNAFLLSPMQRLTRYPMLLKQILHYTPESHPDYSCLCEAISIAQKRLNEANHESRIREDQIEINEIVSVCKMKTDKNVLDLYSSTKHNGPRHFVHKGVLKKSKSGRLLRAFLFNDLLLLCNETTKKRLEIYREPIELWKAKVWRDENDCNVFWLQSDGSKPIGLRARDSEREIWMIKIEEILSENEKIILANTPVSSIENFSLIGTLKVTVQSAVFERTMTTTTPITSFCEISIGSQSLRTRSVRYAGKIVWNEDFVFSVDSIDQFVKFVIFSSRDKYSKADYAGTAEMPLNYLEYLPDSKVSDHQLPIHNSVPGIIMVQLNYRGKNTVSIMKRRNTRSIRRPSISDLI